MSSDGISDFDPERYRAHLAELTLTEEQETELLGILFSIMRTFVEIGFAVEDCGQLLEAFEEAAGIEGDGVSLAEPSIRRGSHIERSRYESTF